MQSKINKLNILSNFIVFSAFLAWTATAISQLSPTTKCSFYDPYSGYIFATFFLISSIMMISGTIILHFIMKQKFSEKDSERKQFMQVFMTITVISILQTIFLFAYAPFQINLWKFQRYLLENFSNLLWDIPVILIMSYNHHLNYKIPDDVVLENEEIKSAKKQKSQDLPKAQ